MQDLKAKLEAWAAGSELWEFKDGTQYQFDRNAEMMLTLLWPVIAAAAEVPDADYGELGEAFKELEARA